MRFLDNFLEPDPLVFIIAPSRTVWPQTTSTLPKVLRLPGNPAAVSRLRAT
jgi:hypothetical protein